MVKRPIHRLVNGGPVPEMDELAEETIVTLRCDGNTVVRLLASPFDLGDLAYGHIACEDGGIFDSLIIDGYEGKIEGNVSRRPSEVLLTPAYGDCRIGDIKIATYSAPNNPTP